MTTWLDRFTGWFPMYKLVLVSLLAITALAFVLSITGQLSYQPLPLFASFVVAVTSTSVSSWLSARIMRTRFHVESAMITAFLLFLIITPSTDPVALLGLALAGVVANVSKYLLAVRGRHVFNPAAVGALVAGIPGLVFVNWWVGSQLLLPLVAVGAILVLYRTQKLLMGLVFVVVAAGLSLAVGFTASTLLSLPIIFFAGFMLSEPLTLPPRRWQQLALAAVLAVPFALPFSAGLANKYLVVLLAGNLIAFAFGQRRGIRLTSTGKTQLNASTWELAFQPSRPVRFVPGQYMELTIPHRRADFRGSRRYFSIASAPTADGPITFAITVPPKSSSFKQALLELEPGAVVHGTSVGGDFALPRDTAQPLLLVAGGIGITPFASQLAHATARGEQRDVVVAYATSGTGALPYAGLLERSGARVVLFGAQPETLPAGWEYGGEGRVTGERLAARIPDLATRRTFVSGPPALVNDLRRALRSQGVRRVRVDAFSGY